MGGASSSVLTQEEVEIYAELTYLKKREVIRAFSIFRNFHPESVDRNYMVRLPSELVRERVPEIKCNPFGDRILKLFSSEQDGRLSFEDFLDMLSVFSRSAPVTLKASYAFRLYDVDEDLFLGRSDLSYVLDRLTRFNDNSIPCIPEQERSAIVERILEESDINRSGSIDLQEFQHVAARCPDFVQSFSFEIV